MNIVSFVFIPVLHLLLLSVECYHILGIFPYPGFSHTIMFQTLMKGLAKSGHNVDVVSRFPQKAQVARYTDLSIPADSNMYTNNVSIQFAAEIIAGRFNLLKFILYSQGFDLCGMMYRNPMIRNLGRLKNKYDLVMTEVFGFDCFMMISEQLKIPAVNMATVSVPWGNDRINNPDNPSYIPAFTPYLSKMTFLQRVDNVISLIICNVWYSIMRIALDADIQNNLGSVASDLYTLERSTSMILINNHFSLNHVRPTVPSFVEVGGLHVAPSPNQTLQGLEQILNVTSTQKYKGVIFFSLGSMVLTETLPREKLVALFDAFSELPYVVLWKADRKNMPSDITAPSNIHFEKWVPQSDVLCYPSVKLFVTHGGLMGTQEALYCGVPCLGIPLFADQELNVKSLEAHGLALSVDYETFTKEDILTTAKELLYNPKFKENADSASNRFRDRPLSPLETAIYWVEYVIRHNGTRHLRSPGADLNWVQYHLLDVGASLAIGTLGIIYISYKFVILLLKILCGFKIGTQTKSK